jgi:hypothetical protein
MMVDAGRRFGAEATRQRVDEHDQHATDRTRLPIGVRSPRGDRVPSAVGR